MDCCRAATIPLHTAQVSGYHMMWSIFDVMAADGMAGWSDCAVDIFIGGNDTCWGEVTPELSGVPQFYTTTYSC